MFITSLEMEVVQIQYCCCCIFSFFIYPSQQSNAVVSDKTDTHTQKSMITSSRGPHLINTLIEEGQAGVFVADKRALLYEAAEHLSLDHERVKPLMGAVPALQEA